MIDTPAAGRRADAPLRGKAALQVVRAEAGRVQGASTAANRAGQSEAAQPPKTVAQVLGEIAWLMTQSPRHKAIPLGDLESRLMPAILLRQFRIFYNDAEQPVGAALWALVDHTVAKRIDAGDSRLTPAEWNSGAIMRIVETVVPLRTQAEMRSVIGDISSWK